MGLPIFKRDSILNFNQKLPYYPGNIEDIISAVNDSGDFSSNSSDKFGKLYVGGVCVGNSLPYTPTVPLSKEDSDGNIKIYLSDQNKTCEYIELSKNNSKPNILIDSIIGSPEYAYGNDHIFTIYNTAGTDKFCNIINRMPGGDTYFDPLSEYEGKVLIPKYGTVQLSVSCFKATNSVPTLIVNSKLIKKSSVVPSNQLWYYAANQVTLYNQTGVQSHTFSNGTGILTFSTDVTVIGQWLRGTSIYGVVFPVSVNEIGSYAFYGCSSLKLSSIPDTVSIIGDYAFYNCSKLRLSSLPIGMTEIGSYTFGNCTDIDSLEILTNDVILIGTTPFVGTIFPIKVKSGLVDTYQQDSDWSIYDSRIQSLDQQDYIISKSGKAFEIVGSPVFGNNGFTYTYTQDGYLDLVLEGDTNAGSLLYIEIGTYYPQYDFYFANISRAFHGIHSLIVKNDTGSAFLIAFDSASFGSYTYIGQYGDGISKAACNLQPGGTVKFDFYLNSNYITMTATFM